jgi:hypothetical protein
MGYDRLSIDNSPISWDFSRGRASCSVRICRWRATCRPLHSRVGGEVSLPVARKPRFHPDRGRASGLGPSHRVGPSRPVPKLYLSALKASNVAFHICWSLGTVSRPEFFPPRPGSGVKVVRRVCDGHRVRLHTAG